MFRCELDRLTGSRKVVAVNLKQENVVSCRVSVTDRRPLDGEKVQTFSYYVFAESSHGPAPRASDRRRIDQ